MLRRLVPAVALPALVVTLPGAATAAPDAPTASRQITYQQWTSDTDFAAGTLAGVRVVDGRLRLAKPVGRRTYTDPHTGVTRRYQLGRWTSPWTTPGHSFTELIPSWDATTRGATWVQVMVRGRAESGQLSKWHPIARWAQGDDKLRRTSVPPVADDFATVSTDVWRAKNSLAFRSWQVRVVLHRRAGTRITPWVDTLGAVASDLPAVSSVPTSRPGVARGITLPVPRYSQMIHRGHYPEYGNGGAAWCSPTSTSMVLAYHQALPTAQEYSWVGAGHAHPWVDHAARSVFDHEYDGAGNWGFNTAYAAGHAGNGFVTRLRDARELERFIKAGIPVVVSGRFSREWISNSPIGRTAGHLLVVVGFTQDGNVVVNDPAARRNKGVRRVYDRGQFENAWLTHSGGVSYVIHTDEQRLPARNGNRNW